MARIKRSRWAITQYGHDPGAAPYFDSLLAISNGTMGCRSTIEPEATREDASFFADIYEPGLAVASELAVCPSWWTISLHGCDGVAGIGSADLDSATVVRRLDLRHGVLGTRMSYELPHVGPVELDTEFLADRTTAGRSVLSGTLRPLPGAAGTGIIIFWLDWSPGNPYGGTENAVQNRHLELVRLAACGHGWEAVFSSPANRHRLMINIATTVGGAERFGTVRLRDRLGEVFRFQPSPGQAAVTFERAATATVGGRASMPPSTADIPTVRAEHERRWQRWWDDNDVVIAGDPKRDSALRHGLYCVSQSLPDPPPKAQSIAARGLTSPYHSGHLFYSAELFLFVYWLYTSPPHARAMLAARYKGLGPAREYAAATGFEGAYFPEEADAAGRPASPFDIRDLASGGKITEWSGPQTLFLSACVALATCWYFRATRDSSFMSDLGVRLLLECGQFSASVVERAVADGTGIGPVMCADEYHYHAYDNAFTNLVIQESLSQTADVLEELADGPLTDRRRFRDAARQVRRPARMAGGTLEEFRGYEDLPEAPTVKLDRIGRPVMAGAVRDDSSHLRAFGTKLIKQGDVMLVHALFPTLYPIAQHATDLDYYGPRTTFESSLSAMPYGIVAARLSDPASAFRYFRLSAEYDLAYWPKREHRSGFHLGAAAGAWQILVNGFLGLRMGEDELILRPAPLPSRWRHLSIPLFWRGGRIRVRWDGRDLVVTHCDRPARRPALRVEPVAAQSIQAQE